MRRSSERDRAMAQCKVCVEALTLPKSLIFPGHPSLPPLLYRRAFAIAAGDEGAGAKAIERVFHHNGWCNGWRDTVYDYEHYHSSAHEVLGCFRGAATLQLGGEGGPTRELAAGDVLLLPAGTAHKKLAERDNFCVVGCYAEGRDYDMLCGEGERASAQQRIRALPLPTRDPVFGEHGPLLAYLGRGCTPGV